jgi:hypothetical protein
MILEKIILNITPALTWFLFVLIFIVTGIIIFYILYKRSKEPEEWKHINIYSNNFDKNTLKKLTESIRYQTVEYDYEASLGELIQMMFFKKIESNKGVSVEELYEVKNSNPQTLRSIINDDRIYNWIIKLDTEKSKNSIFNKKKIKDKEEYLKDVNLILDRMEAWA